MKTCKNLLPGKDLHPRPLELKSKSLSRNYDRIWPASEKSEPEPEQNCNRIKTGICEDFGQLELNKPKKIENR